MNVWHSVMRMYLKLRQTISNLNNNNVYIRLA